MASVCTACDKPLPDGMTLCYDDASDLRADLEAVPGVWEDIQTTGARLDVGAASVGSSGHKAPRAAANLDALDKAQTLRVVLGGWVNHLPRLHPAGDPVKTAAWLITQMDTICKQGWAADLKQELRDALNACRWATDRAAERVNLGPCWNCDGTITAIQGATMARCRACKMTYESKAVQQWMISEAWHVWTFLPDIVRALAQSGYAKINAQKAKNWVHSGKLAADRCDVATRRCLYTPAAVLAVYRETPTGRREHQATRGDSSLVA